MDASEGVGAGDVKGACAFAQRTHELCNNIAPKAVVSSEADKQSASDGSDNLEGRSPTLGSGASSIGQQQRRRF